MASDATVLFRDSAEIQPGEDGIIETRQSHRNVYQELPPAKFIACTDDIWVPQSKGEGDDEGVVVVAKTPFQIMLGHLQTRTVAVLDAKLTVLLVFVMTLWALFMDDFAISIPMDKAVDVPFAYVTLIFLVLFAIEQFTRSLAQYNEYCARQPRLHGVVPPPPLLQPGLFARRLHAGFGFFWWMELAANLSMIFSLGPLYTPVDECSSTAFNLADGVPLSRRCHRMSWLCHGCCGTLRPTPAPDAVHEPYTRDSLEAEVATAISRPAICGDFPHHPLPWHFPGTSLVASALAQCTPCHRSRLPLRHTRLQCTRL